MALNIPYLIVFIIYLLVILCIGLWGWRQVTTQAEFATANQGLSLTLTTASLLGTYISALTIIGGIGYASTYGWAFITLYSAGVIAGSAFLSFAAKKLHNTRANSLSEMLMMRFKSKALRALTAGIVVFTFAIILVAQLFGIGFILEGTIGIPMPIAIFGVGLFIALYTLLGGMISVARTDLLQAIIMGAGLIAILSALIWKIVTDPAHSFTENPALMSIYAGATSTNLGLLAMFLTLGLGTAIHPYFVQKVFAAKDVRTARLAPALTAVGAFLIYVCVTIIGIIGALYLPDMAGDTMMPAIIVRLIPGALGAFAVITLIAVVQSTTDSLLHAIGVYLSQDIFGVYVLRSPTDRQLLRWSRIFTAIFGVICVGFATYQATFGSLTLLAIIASYAWSIIGGSLFVVVTAALFWQRCTWQGAVAAVLTGFLAGIIGGELFRQGVVPFRGIIPAVVLSVASIIIVSLITQPTSQQTPARHMKAPADESSSTF
jgi:SSS family solute:Na+ symporter